MGDLAVQTAVEAVDEGRYSAKLHEDWRIWGPNGGYVASVALRAAGEASVQPRPASIAVHYLGVAAFDAVDIKVQTLRATRRAESLRVSITQGDRPILDALVWAVADGIDALAHEHAAMPEVPPPDEIPTMEQRFADAGLDASPFPFWDNIDNRGLQWRPDWPPPGPLEPVGRWWCRYRPTETFPDRWVDACRALLLVDTFGWPAAAGAFAWENEVGGVQRFIAPTTDLHCTFHAFDHAEPWLFVEAVSPGAAEGLVAARATVWSAAGRLLASGGQTMLMTRAPS